MWYSGQSIFNLSGIVHKSSSLWYILIARSGLYLAIYILKESITSNSAPSISSLIKSGRSSFLKVDTNSPADRTFITSLPSSLILEPASSFLNLNSPSFFPSPLLKNFTPLLFILLLSISFLYVSLFGSKAYINRRFGIYF